MKTMKENVQDIISGLPYRPLIYPGQESRNRRGWKMLKKADDALG